MTYQHCPRCRLAIRCRAPYLLLTNCPRCLARTGIASPLFCSPLNARELHQHAAITSDRTITAPVRTLPAASTHGPRSASRPSQDVRSSKSA